MKKIYLIVCLMSAFMITGISKSNAQCNVDSLLNGIYLFNNPNCDGVVLNPLCIDLDSVGTTGLGGYYDGDGYVLPLIAGTTVVISTDSCTGNPVSLTIADSSNTVIPGAYSAAACPNTLTFTATYTGDYIVVMNVNGVCAAGGTTLVGQVYAKIQPGTTPPACMSAVGALVNDSICGAIPLTLDGPRISGNNTTAVYEDEMDGEIFNSFTCSTPNNTLWYSFTSPVDIDTMYVLITSDAGSGFASWVGSFVASDSANPCTSCLNGIGCVNGADDLAGNDSVAISFAGVVANEIYYFMIDGVLDGVGGFSIGLQSYGAFTNVSSVVTAHDFAVYPNPASSEINITAKETFGEDIMVNLINSVGQVVITKNFANFSNTHLDVNGLSEGLYIVKITNSKGTFDKKVLITGNHN